jgi:hypothetical protein
VNVPRGGREPTGRTCDVGVTTTAGRACRLGHPASAVVSEPIEQVKARRKTRLQSDLGVMMSLKMVRVLAVVGEILSELQKIYPMKSHGDGKSLRSDDFANGCGVVWPGNQKDQTLRDLSRGCLALKIH